VITPWLAFPIIIKNSAPFSRKDFQIYLEKNNIQTRVVFTGNILRQPCFKKYKKFYAGEKFIESDLVMKGGVLLGCHQGLTTRHLDYLHKKVENFIKLNA
jgi:CDP-6-deoxy-D-xylo-4-hexulose-3-dehydrase